MKKRVTKFFFLMLILPVLFIGCQKSELTDDSKIGKTENDGSANLKNTIVYCGTPLVANLVDYELTINPGIVTVGNDATKLYVTYELSGDWWIASSVLFVGPASEAGTIYPNGSGLFDPSEWVAPYRHDFFPWDYTQTHTYEIDLNTLDNCFIIVNYVAVKNLVTGVVKYVWGKSLLKNLGYYLNYCKQTCQPPTTCETAYAYGGEPIAKCFLNIPGVTSNNWGWSNGPIGAGTYSWPIYAGAGQCNTNNGTLVGTLLVNYTPPTATITYSMGSGFVLNATHLYVGSQILPKKNGKFTTAPGQFPYKHENLNGLFSDTFTINGLSGNIYIAAHSEACGNY